MSGCHMGQAGSMFCEGCRDYNCSGNPNWSPVLYEPSEEEIYKGVEHMKGVKAPDIPEVDIKEETKKGIEFIWNNFSDNNKL